MRSKTSAFSPDRQHKLGSRNAQVYFVPCSDGHRFVVAKAARTSGENFAQSLRNEYLALQEVSNRAGEALADSFPRPLFLLEKEGILILSGVAGVSLAKRLRREANVFSGWRSLDRMREIGLRLGEWLQLFHGATASEIRMHHHEDYLSELDSNSCRSQELGVAASVLHQVRERAEASSRPLNGTPVPAAATHGDFVPTNILFLGSRVGVVDFGSYCGQAPIYRDPAAFVAYIKLLASKPRYSRRALETLADHFLLGYAQRLNHDLFRAFVLNAMLRITNDGARGVLSARDSRRIGKALLAAAHGTGCSEHDAE
ncbi:MAG: phosphotransferase [Terriglobia bacterium]